MHFRFVLAVACALALGSCENRPPLAPSAEDTTLGLTAFSVLSESYNLTANQPFDTFRQIIDRALSSSSRVTP